MVNNPSIIPSFNLRNYRGKLDHASIASVLTASQNADGIERNVTEADISQAYAHRLKNSDPTQDMIIAEVEGEMVGYARGWWDAESPDLYLYHSLGALLPAWRRKRIGTALLGWVESRLGTVSENHPRAARKFFQVSLAQSETGTAHLLKQADYIPVRIYIHMLRPDLEQIPDLPLPPGLELRPAAPDKYRAIWDSIYEADTEEWGTKPPSEEEYQAWLSDPLFQPKLWQVAWDLENGRPVGHVLTHINAEENKQFHRKRGYTEGIGVSPAWRGRGLATALIYQSLKVQREIGMSESALVVDSENTSNASRLYEKCGFQVVKQDTVYRKEMARGN